MIDQAHNLGDTVKTVPENRELMYRLLDDLPPQLRDLIKYAPYNYAVRPFYERWLSLRNHGPVEIIARELGRAMARRRREEVLRLYGPDHPQARA